MVEPRVRREVRIKEEQFGNMQRGSTTDAIFPLNMLMEKEFKGRQGRKERGDECKHYNNNHVHGGWPMAHLHPRETCVSGSWEMFTRH